MLVVLVYGLAGCSLQSKTRYHQAGEHLVSATRDTGKAIQADATHVRDSARSAILHDKVSDAVKSALLAEDELHLKDFNVTSQGQVITLIGTAPNEIMNQRAEQLARSVAGPAYVIDDQLKVPAQN